MLSVYNSMGKARTLESFIDESDKNQFDREQKPLEFIHFFNLDPYPSYVTDHSNEPSDGRHVYHRTKTFCLGLEKTSKAVFRIRAFMMFLQQLSSQREQKANILISKLIVHLTILIPLQCCSPRWLSPSPI